MLKNLFKCLIWLSIVFSLRNSKKWHVISTWNLFVKLSFHNNTFCLLNIVETSFLKNKKYDE